MLKLHLRSVLFGLGFVSLLSPSPARAVLIDAGDATLDTLTNLLWLDAALSEDLDDFGFESYPGLVSQGWRLATSSEVCGLMANYAGGGLSPCPLPADTPFSLPLPSGPLVGTDLQNTIWNGFTFSGSAGSVMIYAGFGSALDPFDNPDDFDVPALIISNMGGGIIAPGLRYSVLERAQLLDKGLALFIGSPARRHLLMVQEASVPEPGMLALLGIGAATALSAWRSVRRG